MAHGSVAAAEDQEPHDINDLRKRDTDLAHSMPSLSQTSHMNDSAGQRFDSHDDPLLRPHDEDDETIELYPLHVDRGSPIQRIQWQTLGDEIAFNHPTRSDLTSKPHVSASWIAVVLLLTVLGFTVNTEATAYFEDTLGWKKPFATMYITHSSLMLPWLCHTCWLRWRSRHIPFWQWSRGYCDRLQAAIARIEAYTPGDRRYRNGSNDNGDAMVYLMRKTALITCVLTVSGATWFFALGLTTPADLTAIYNCSTFFAAVFSVPLLRERLGVWSILAVGLSLIGTFTIAYGDSISTPSATPTSESSISVAVAGVRDETPSTAAPMIGSNRVLGNLLSIIGALAFGLYEVLLKKWACPAPETATGEKSGGDPSDTLPLTLAASALTGFYTFAFLWVGLIVLHICGVEVFEMPGLVTIGWIIIGVLSGAFSLTLLVVLVIWTDPVFGSMANVLSVFAVAIADWLVWSIAPSLATYAGGALIVLAFVMLARDSFRLM